MPSIACVNGHYSSPETATIPIDDRGFLFGDAVYETMRAYHGRVWALERHWARLSQSLSETRIRVSLVQTREWLDEAVRRADIPDSLIYLQITRGVAPRQHTFDDTLVPTILITVRPAKSLTLEQRSSGVSAITFADLRWERRDIKTINLLPNVMAKQEAYQQGAFEAVLVDPDGLVTEGSSTNVMAVLDGVLRTAPANHRILGGVTREMVLELARADGIPVVEEAITRRDLERVEELMFTGTTAEVLGITRLDGRPVAGGRVGPISQRLYELFYQCIVAGRDCPREKPG